MKLTSTECVTHNALILTAYAESNSGTRWRARIRRDFYDFQSQAIAERWDGTKWQEAYRALDITTLRIHKHSTMTNSNVWKADGEYDALFLLTTAALSIGE